MDWFEFCWGLGDWVIGRFFIDVESEGGCGLCMLVGLWMLLIMEGEEEKRELIFAKEIYWNFIYYFLFLPQTIIGLFYFFLEILELYSVKKITIHVNGSYSQAYQKVPGGQEMLGHSPIDLTRLTTLCISSSSSSQAY